MSEPPSREADLGAWEKEVQERLEGLYKTESRYLEVEVRRLQTSEEIGQMDTDREESYQTDNAIVGIQPSRQFENCEGGPFSSRVSIVTESESKKIYALTQLQGVTEGPTAKASYDNTKAALLSGLDSKFHGFVHFLRLGSSTAGWDMVRTRRRPLEYLITENLKKAASEALYLY